MHPRLKLKVILTVITAPEDSYQYMEKRETSLVRKDHSELGQEVPPPTSHPYPLMTVAATRHRVWSAVIQPTPGGANAGLAYPQSQLMQFTQATDWWRISTSTCQLANMVPLLPPSPTWVWKKRGESRRGSVEEQDLVHLAQGHHSRSWHISGKRVCLACDLRCQEVSVFCKYFHRKESFHCPKSCKKPLQSQHTIRPFLSSPSHPVTGLLSNNHSGLQFPALYLKACPAYMRHICCAL